MLAFYTMPEYEAWCERTNTQGWAIKYYKGLGTSDAKEAKEYFADIDDHRKTFVWNGEGPAFACCHTCGRSAVWSLVPWRQLLSWLLLSRCVGSSARYC